MLSAPSSIVSVGKAGTSNLSTPAPSADNPHPPKKAKLEEYPLQDMEVSGEVDLELTDKADIDDKDVLQDKPRMQSNSTKVVPEFTTMVRTVTVPQELPYAGHPVTQDLRLTVCTDPRHLRCCDWCRGWFLRKGWRPDFDYDADNEDDGHHKKRNPPSPQYEYAADSRGPDAFPSAADVTEALRSIVRQGTPPIPAGFTRVGPAVNYSKEFAKYLQLKKSVSGYMSSNSDLGNDAAVDNAKSVDEEVDELNEGAEKMATEEQ